MQWLWARVDTCRRISDPSVSGRPERQACVVAALQPCALCANKEACSFVTKIRTQCSKREKKVRGDGGSDESSLWENEGTSDSQSRSADEAQLPRKKQLSKGAKKAQNTGVRRHQFFRSQRLFRHQCFRSQRLFQPCLGIDLGPRFCW